ncbi:MAG: DUF5615 family PIN-like protein [Cyanobacteria bacterium SBLK]|nr:DUF5615 family PIN-like protein [Cyanobacteria bacterium SBLK]
MFRFYANENLALILVETLRQLGHDVLTSSEAGNANKGAADREVLSYAATEKRIVITFNRKDFIVLHQSGINHSGSVICKDDRDYFNQARVIHEYSIEQGSFENRLIRIQKQNQPKSSKPVFIVREYQRSEE